MNRYFRSFRSTSFVLALAILQTVSLTACSASTTQGNGRQTGQACPVGSESQGTCDGVASKTVTLQGFNAAGFLAVDRKGNIYTSGDTHSLVKFSPDGVLLRSWDGLDALAYSPDKIGGITLDSQGNVYVADLSASRLVKLSSVLKVLGQWGGMAYQKNKMIVPASLAVSHAGDIIFTDASNSNVLTLSSKGQLLSSWGTPDQFRVPLGLALDKAQQVYVADTGHNRVVKLSAEGTTIAKWGTKLHLSSPVDVTVAPSGRAYISDSGNRRIIQLQRPGHGKIIFKEDAGSNLVPSGIASDNHGRLYVSECPTGTQTITRCRIVKLSTKGKVLETWLSSGALPASLAAPHTTDGKVDVGGYSLHYHCVGEGSPTVILESGLGSSSSPWSVVQARAGHLTRVCSYDRAGMGQSDPRPSSLPSTSEQMVKELHTLLQGAHIAAPYILVGHSLGGFNVRLYAYTYPQDVVGMILVDSMNENQCILPSPSTSRYCPANSGKEAVQLKESASEVEQATKGVINDSLGNIPLIVLTAALTSNPCTDSCKTLLSYWLTLQDQLASTSSDSVHVLAPWSGHLIQLQEPGLVLAAIQEVLDSARNKQPLPTCGYTLTSFGGACLP